MVSVIIPTTKPSPYFPNVELPSEYQLIVVYDIDKKGKGRALQEGFKQSTGDRIVWFDDGDDIFPWVIEKALSYNADIVIGSKLNPKSIYTAPLRRKILTWISALTTKLLFNLPLRDTQTGLKVFKREVLDYPWVIQGFGHDIEVLAKSYHRGYTILEIPISVIIGKESTVTFLSCLRTFIEILRVRMMI